MSKGHDKHQERVGLVGSLGKALARRSGSCCEMCLRCGVALAPWEVPPVKAEPDIDRAIFVCDECKSQMTHPKKIDPNHWHCLHKSVWSDVTAVKVTAVAMLQRLQSEDWAEELIEQVYLEPEEQAWVEKALNEEW